MAAHGVSVEERDNGGDAVDIDTQKLQNLKPEIVFDRVTDKNDLS